MAFSLTGGQGWSMGIDNSGGDSFMIHDSSGGVDSSSQFTITTAGNVGIGETNPDTILHISDGNTADPSTNAPVIRLQNTSVNCSNQFTDGDVIGGLEFYNDSIICTDIAYSAGVNAYVRAVHDGSNSPTPTSSLEFGTGTATSVSTQMTIDSSGRVGINETDPSGYWSQANNIVIDTSGNGGITIKSTSAGNGRLVFTDTKSSTAGLNDGGMIAYSHTNDEMTFNANGSTAMTIESSGNVAINEFLRVGGNVNNANTFTYTLQSRGLLVAGDSGTSESNLYLHRDDVTISAGNVIGNLHFSGQDGASNIGAQIRAEAAASWSATSAPSNIIFSNCTSGSNTLTPRMVIDSSGRVGIGQTSIPSTVLLDLKEPDSGSDLIVGLTAGTGARAQIRSEVQSTNNTAELSFHTVTGNVTGERMRIDSSGTTTITKTQVTGSFDTTSFLRLHPSTTVNSGGFTNMFFGTSELDNYGISLGGLRDGTDGTPTFIIKTHFNDGTGAERMRIQSGGIIELGDCAEVIPSSVTSFIRFVPAADTTVDLGAGSKRWEEVFSVQSSINTSDENEKQQIENLDEVELRVAQRIKGLIRKFKWNSAVENKGDNARIHFGVIAQDLQRAFEAEGLDAEKYGLFCSDTWWEEEIIETDEEGNEKTKIKTYEEYKEGAIEKTRLGVRYTELLAFVIAAL